MNPLAAWLELLGEQGGVTALVSTRIYGGHLPGGADLFPCVLCRRVGGAPEFTIPIHGSLIDVWCYAATFIAADTVHQAIYSTLHGKNGLTSANYHLYFIQEILGGIEGQEAITDREIFRFIFSTWKIDVSQ